MIGQASDSASPPSQANAFWIQARLNPNEIAVIEPDGTAIDFAKLLDECNQIANGLQSLGLQRGDAVAFMLPNGALLCEVALAALQTGLYLVPINWHLTSYEVQYLLEQSDARALFTNDQIGSVASLAAENAQIPAEARIAEGPVPGFRPLLDFIANQPLSPPSVRTPGQFMYYTSGTTGSPKGVRRRLPDGDPDSVAAIGSDDLASRFPRLGYAKRGHHLVPGPMYHANPLRHGLNALHRGRTLVLMASVDAQSMLDLIERYEVTSITAAPIILHRLLQLPDEVRMSQVTASLQHVLIAGSPCPIELKQRMIEWWGPIIDELYAASEGGGTDITCEEWLRRPGSVGRPRPGNVVKILAADGTECPPGRIGEIFMGPMAFEYYKDPAATQAARHGDLFTVGDYGFLDADGYLFLADRSADIIVSGAVNVYPAEIEAVLMMHPAVHDAVVVGIPNSEWGEEIKAVVERRKGSDAGTDLEAELIAYCRARLAHFKCPRSVDFTDQPLRSSSGKLLRRKVREPYWAGKNRKI